MSDDSEQQRLELNAETGAAATLDIYAEARKDFDEAGVTRNAIARKIKRLMSWKETKVFQPRGDIFIPLPPGQPEGVAPGPVVSEKKKGGKERPRNPGRTRFLSSFPASSSIRALWPPEISSSGQLTSRPNSGEKSSPTEKLNTRSREEYRSSTLNFHPRR